MNSIDYPQPVKNLPIYNDLDSICKSLRESASHFLVLTAETAAGKSTALPLALLKHFDGNILMLEPRRIAVLNIASRVSELLGEETGKTCGYQMHLENRTSKETRFTVLTEAILTKKLQSDPSLEGISVVVIDEFHERSIHADLALAFLKESMALRDDLYVIVMSATIDTEKLCSYLDAPLYKVKGRQFPVKVEYKADKSVVQAVKAELGSGDTGSMLVFLPGIREIRRAYEEIEPYIDNQSEELLILHSSVSLKEQKDILRGSSEGKRRIILSSAIAETSITVPDVDLVIDSGLSRISSWNPNIQMTHLITVNESMFNAEQRAGRAGRIREGRCVRLWSEHEGRPENLNPEILRSDLSPLILECSAWGVTDMQGIDFLDNPSKALWDTSSALLKMLKLIDERGAITAKGRAVLSLPLEPRAACVVLGGLEDNTVKQCIELVLKYSTYASAGEFLVNKAKEEILRRVNSVKNSLEFTQNSTVSTGFSTGVALFHGYPDRLARLFDAKNSIYQLYSGRLARIAKDKNTPNSIWIVAVDVDSGDSQATIYDYETIKEEEALALIEPYLSTEETVEFVEGTADLRKTEYTRYGRITVKSRKLNLQEGDYVRAICSKIKDKGLDFVPKGKKTESLLLRMKFYLQNTKDGEKQQELQTKLEELTVKPEEWLLPFVHVKSDFNEENIYQALHYVLEGDLIDREVPVELVLENGKKRRLSYEDINGQIKPFLEIIIQQVFGVFRTPKVMGMNVTLRLLSPARRPLQVTQDLENFWIETWPEICKEMKGRYPKHNWDYRQVQKDEQ